MQTMNISYNLDDLDQVAQEVKDAIADCAIVTFTGSLGAGKTTLIRAIARALGIKDEVTSPTFTYMNIYRFDDDKRLVHFDLYRLQHIDEFIAAGFDEYLSEDKIFIEWPEVIKPLLDQIKACHITIDYDGVDRRVLHLTKS